MAMRHGSVYTIRMQNHDVHLVNHPLVQHKLSLMREKDRSIKGFRELLNEIGMLLCYEVGVLAAWLIERRRARNASETALTTTQAS